MMGICYKVTLKAMRRSANEKTSDASKCYNALKNKKSEYAKDVLAILNIRIKISEMLKNVREI